jgi:hypothetical protein
MSESGKPTSWPGRRKRFLSRSSITREVSRLPSSPRGWFCKAIYTLDSQARTFSPSYEYTGRSDYRTRCSREESLSIKIIAERASHAVSENGVGYALLMRFYLGEASWHTFTEHEQRILRKTIRHFSKALRGAGFLPDRGKDAAGEDNAL